MFKLVYKLGVSRNPNKHRIAVFCIDQCLNVDKRDVHISVLEPGKQWSLDINDPKLGRLNLGVWEHTGSFLVCKNHSYVTTYLDLKSLKNIKWMLFNMLVLEFASSDLGTGAGKNKLTALITTGIDGDTVSRHVSGIGFVNRGPAIGITKRVIVKRVLSEGIRLYKLNAYSTGQRIQLGIWHLDYVEKTAVVKTAVCGDGSKLSPGLIKTLGQALWDWIQLDYGTEVGKLK